MRIAIIADIHGNLTAFKAVLDDIGQRGGVKGYWCLGDVVGYGPEPRQCLDLLRSLKHVCVAGNHDWAAIDKISTADLNPDAAIACRWTAKQLRKKDIAYLESLPLTIVKNSFTLVHGSPREPIGEYVISMNIAQTNFSFFETRYCLVGHSHTPLVFKEEKGETTSSRLFPDIKLLLGESRLIINPGGVGQPRDGDPRASYAIFDSDFGNINLHRVPYDIEAVQEKIMKEGLPLRLATRLSHGT
ncbi:metallophosphoesterase family protein [Chloroflexota bacterium]